jgi:hypothetical protein
MAAIRARLAQAQAADAAPAGLKAAFRKATGRGMADEFKRRHAPRSGPIRPTRTSPP